MAVTAQIVRDVWSRKKGYYLMVYSGPRGKVWGRTRSADTAARMSQFGFLGADFVEVRWAGLKLHELPIYS